MMLSIEVSMYPFRDDYRDVIKDVVAEWKKYDGLRVDMRSTSSLIVGEYDLAMESLHRIMRWSYEKYGRCAFVAKLIPDYDASP